MNRLRLISFSMLAMTLVSLSFSLVQQADANAFDFVIGAMVKAKGAAEPVEKLKSILPNGSTDKFRKALGLTPADLKKGPFAGRPETLSHVIFGSIHTEPRRFLLITPFFTENQSFKGVVFELVSEINYKTDGAWAETKVLADSVRRASKLERLGDPLTPEKIWLNDGWFFSERILLSFEEKTERQIFNAASEMMDILKNSFDEIKITPTPLMPQDLSR